MLVTSLSRKLYRLRYPESAVFSGVDYRDSLFSNDEKLVTERFNTVWKYATSKFSLYRDLKYENALPLRISSTDELKHFPLLRKSKIQEYSDTIRRESETKRYSSTGGSTGTPLKFPIDRTNAARAFNNISAARLAFGIYPWDRTALIWGHSHLFGSGLGGYALRAKRLVMDRVSNTERLTAYNLDERMVRRHVDRLIRTQPKLVVAYASVARLIYSSGYRLRELPKKWVLTSETILETDYELLTKNGAELIAEYGLAEFGPIAYSHPDSRTIKPFTASFHFNLIKPQNRLAVSDLVCTAFPFINYDTGDLIETTNSGEWARVIGRESDIIGIPTINGSEIRSHSEIISHVIKTLSVKRFNYENRSGNLFINVPLGHDTEKLRGQILRELAREFSNIDSKRIFVTDLYNRKVSSSGKELIVSSSNE